MYVFVESQGMFCNLISVIDMASLNMRDGDKHYDKQMAYLIAIETIL